jgi:hypothetical protein
MPAAKSKNNRRSLLSPEIQEARNIMRRRGWSQAEAAAELGVTAMHLCLVLNGHRPSQRLLSAIKALPENPTPA